MKIGYKVVFQNLAWIGADTELALHQRVIPPVSTLNILSSKFCAVPIPSYLWNDLEPFTIVPLVQGLDKKKAAKERS